MSISTDSGDPETLKEVMTRPNGNLWEISTISEVKKCLSRKAWVTTKRSVVKNKSESQYLSSGYLRVRKRLTY